MSQLTKAKKVKYYDMIEVPHLYLQLNLVTYKKDYSPTKHEFYF